MHVHTRRHSACGRAEPQEMVAAARRFGLDAIVFTEHHVVWGEEELAELQHEFSSVRLFTGVEISTEASGDLLVIGAEGTDWFAPRMPAEIAVEEAHARGGIVIAAHPYRAGYGTKGLDKLPLDAAEIYSLHMHLGAHQQAVRLASARDLHTVATSDAHAPDAVGLYAIRLDEPAVSERALAEIVLAGMYTLFADENRVEALNRDREPAWREAQRLIGEGLDDGDVVARVDGVGYTEARLLRQGQPMSWPLPASMEVFE